MTQRLHRLQEIDRATSMATLWKEAKATVNSSSAAGDKGVAGAADNADASSTDDNGNTQVKPQSHGSANSRMDAAGMAAAESTAIDNYLKRYPGA